MRNLALLSFLVASAHGAGLMVVPFVLVDSAGASIAGDTAGPAFATLAPATPEPMSGGALESRNVPDEWVDAGASGFFALRRKAAPFGNNAPLKVKSVFLLIGMLAPKSSKIRPTL